MQNEVRRVRQSASCMEQAKIALTPLYELPGLKVTRFSLLGLRGAAVRGAPRRGSLHRPAFPCPAPAPLLCCLPPHPLQNYSSNSTVALLAEAAAEAAALSDEGAAELEPPAEPAAAATDAVWAAVCSAAAAPLTSCDPLDGAQLEQWQAQQGAGGGAQLAWAWPGTPAGLPPVDYREAAEAVCACLAGVPAPGAGERGEGAGDKRCSAAAGATAPTACLLPALPLPCRRRQRLVCAAPQRRLLPGRRPAVLCGLQRAAPGPVGLPRLAGRPGGSGGPAARGGRVRSATNLLE